jgi:hypothetical protein
LIIKKSLKILNGVIRSHKTKKDRQYNEWPKEKRIQGKQRSTKLMIEHHEPRKKPGMNSGAPEVYAVSPTLVASVVFGSYSNFL